MKYCAPEIDAGAGVTIDDVAYLTGTTSEDICETTFGTQVKDECEQHLEDNTLVECGDSMLANNRVGYDEDGWILKEERSRKRSAHGYRRLYMVTSRRTLSFDC